MKMKLNFLFAACVVILLLVSVPVSASPAARSTDPCAALPNHDAVTTALKAAQADKNGGFGLNMWATVVNRDGIVCVVTFTGAERGDQFPGSRLVSAAKANTANALSLANLAISTAQLYTGTQPGGSLYGIQFGLPMDTSVAYGGDPADYGQANDPMIGKHIGGMQVFGGGLALYGSDGTPLGGIGVSGDSSCADHNIVWKTRHSLKLDYVPGGVSPTGDDNIVYDIDAKGHSASGWGHPECSPDSTTIAKDLPKTNPISKKK